MRVPIFILAIVCSALPAVGQEKISLHESVRIAQIISGYSYYHSHTHRTLSGENGGSADEQFWQMLKATSTVTSVKDGSATEMSVKVDPSSYNIRQDSGGKTTKTPWSISGQTVNLRRRADQDVVNDYSGDIDDQELDMLNGLLNPDEDFFPDHPITVGDVWDASDKLSPHSDLGRGDQLMAKCRLDWIRQTNGKKMAQITCSCATLHRGTDSQGETEYSVVMLVDVAACQIIKADQAGSSKLTTADGNSTTDFSFHGEVTDSAKD